MSFLRLNVFCTGVAPAAKRCPSAICLLITDGNLKYGVGGGFQYYNIHPKLCANEVFQQLKWYDALSSYNPLLPLFRIENMLKLACFFIEHFKCHLDMALLPSE